MKNGTGNLPPLWIDEDDYELKSEIRVLTLSARRNNPVLLERYSLGAFYHLNNKTFRGDSPKHRVAAFLYSYFGKEVEAISYLEEVSPTNIDRLTTCEKEVIIASRTPKVQGPDLSWMDEMWQDDANMKDLLERLFPSSLPILNASSLKRPRSDHEDNDDVTQAVTPQSPKRRRHNPHPTNPLGITSRDPTPETTDLVQDDPSLKEIIIDSWIR
jgi:hypothetical protein